MKNIAFLILSASTLTLASVEAIAASVVNRFAHNGLFINEFIETGYGLDPSTGTAISSSTLTPHGIFDTLASGGTDRTGTTVTVGDSITHGSPPSGIGTADATGTINFNFGDSLNPDNFNIRFNGISSATSAATSAGTPLGAGSLFISSMSFSVDPLPGPGSIGTQAGIFKVFPLAPLGRYEFAIINWHDSAGGPLGGPTDRDLSRSLTDAGASPVLRPLIFGHQYELQIAMGISVPHGIDPAFDMQLTGSVLPAPVPVPPAVWLMGSSLLGLAIFSRKKKPAHPAGNHQSVAPKQC